MEHRRSDSISNPRAPGKKLPVWLIQFPLQSLCSVCSRWDQEAQFQPWDIIVWWCHENMFKQSVADDWRGVWLFPCITQQPCGNFQLSLRPFATILIFCIYLPRRWNRRIQKFRVMRSPTLMRRMWKNSAASSSSTDFCKGNDGHAVLLSCIAQGGDRAKPKHGGMTVICEIFHFLNRLCIQCKKFSSLVSACIKAVPVSPLHQHNAGATLDYTPTLAFPAFFWIWLHANGH